MSKEINFKKYCDRKTYDGQALAEGMVLVPVWLDRGMVKANKSILSENLTTWKFGGFKFLIGFAPIEPDSYENYMKWFWKQINDFLDEKRAGRCIIGKTADGKPVLCQAKECSKCENKNLFERAKKPEADVLSLDKFLEDDDFEMEDCTNPTPEDTYLMKVMLDDLIEHLRSIKPRYADIVTLGNEGYLPEEIIEKIHLKPSRGYQEIDACYKLAVEFLYSNK